MFQVIFIFLLPTAVFLILHFMSRKKTSVESPPTDPTEVCALCQNDFPISQLLEKEVGNYGRIYCFCGECIEKLSNEFKNRSEKELGE